MNETLNISSLDAKSLAIIIVCGILALFGIYKILRHGISLLFWVLLVVVGALGMGYVLRPDLTSDVVDKIKSGEFISLIPEEQKHTLLDHLKQASTESNK
ncbi:MAG: hypothetical protein GY797_06090 [Deltaproteobacteria bacterium]|nr:hypothetical protein [Deltaproteobacteria bacterium]MCP5002984.1 hypothetical protein [Planctomycetota bacterium]